MHRIKKFQKPFLLSLAGLILVGQLTFMIGHLQQASNHRGIVAAFDDDAAAAIDKAVITRFYNQVTNHYYGPVYNRLAHVVASLSPNEVGGNDLSKMEAMEKSHHFILMLISYFSLVFLSFLLVSSIVSDLSFRIMGTAFLSFLFLSNEVWLKFVFRAHPDHLFGLLVAVATILFFQSVQNPENSRQFKIAALVWGFAAATKLTILFFLPAVLILVWFHWGRSSLKKIMNFFGWFYLAFFAIGFPASIQVDKNFHAMMNQSVFSGAPTVESILEWLGLYAHQMALPLLFLFFLAVLFGNKRSDSAKTTTIFILVMHLPLALLFSRRIVSIHNYYLIPFVAVSLLCSALFLNIRIQGLLSQRWRPAFLIGLVLVWKMSVGFTPVGIDGMMTLQTGKHSEIEKTFETVKDLQMQGYRFVVSPLFPFSYEYDSNVRMYWSGWDKALNSNSPDFLGFSNSFYSRFFDKSMAEYLESGSAFPSGDKAFFERFAGKNEATDPAGRRWSLLERSPSGLEIWKRMEH